MLIVKRGFAVLRPTGYQFHGDLTPRLIFNNIPYLAAYGVFYPTVRQLGTRILPQRILCPAVLLLQIKPYKHSDVVSVPGTYMYGHFPTYAGLPVRERIRELKVWFDTKCYDDPLAWFAGNTHNHPEIQVVTTPRRLSWDFPEDPDYDVGEMGSSNPIGTTPCLVSVCLLLLEDSLLKEAYQEKTHVDC